MYRPTAVLLTALVCLTACGDDGVSIRDDKLSTKIHQDPRTYFVTAPLTADVTWQLLGFTETEDGIRVSVGYDVVVENPTQVRVDVHISKLTFEDRQGVVVATYSPEGGIANGTVEVRAAAQFTSQAQIDVPSIYDANRIVISVLWATFAEAEAETDG